MNHCIDLNDLSLEEIESLFTLAKKLKNYVRNGFEHHLLKGKTRGDDFLQVLDEDQGFLRSGDVSGWADIRCS